MPFFLERGLGKGIIPLFCGPNLSTEAMDQPPISSGKSSSWVEADLLLRCGAILHKKGCGSDPALSKGNSPWPVPCLSDRYLSSAEPGVVVMQRSVPQDPEPPNSPSFSSSSIPFPPSASVSCLNFFKGFLPFCFYTLYIL